MQANELRIDNWVKHREDAVSASEFPGTIFQIGIEHFYDMVTFHLHKDDLQPIPLTEEWLLKFGLLPSQGNTIFRIDESELLFAIIKEDGNFYLGDWDDEYFTFLKMNDRQIKHVHQLQNLYFALTGKELEIKQPAPSHNQ